MKKTTQDINGSAKFC